MLDEKFEFFLSKPVERKTTLGSVWLVEADFNYDRFCWNNPTYVLELIRIDNLWTYYQMDAYPSFCFLDKVTNFILKRRAYSN